MKKVTWAEIKQIKDSRNSRFQHKTYDWGYRVETFDGPYGFYAVIDEDDNGGSDKTDFETNYLSQSNQTVDPRDSDGAQITKEKIVPEGWAYQLRGFDVSIGLLGCVESLDAQGNEKNDFTVKHYNAADNEVNTQLGITTTAVKTVIDWEPSHDYAIVGGKVYQDSDPVGDIRIGVIAAPGIPKASGGNVEFGMGINLRYIGKSGSVSMDGRNPKILAYNAVYHSSLLRVCLLYPVGTTHTFHLLFELFNPPGV